MREELIPTLICAALVWLSGIARAAEVRALWVDAYHPGFKNPGEVRRLLADVRAAHFNTILVEVRKRGDAYYQSQFEPRADDTAPSFDPLAAVIVEAHAGKPRIEVHAWITTFPIWNNHSAKPTATNHVYIDHPDWLTQSDSGEMWEGTSFWLDPGHPAVQEHVFHVAMDIITHYALDGFHLDYIRYPGRNWGYNPVAVSRFNTLLGRTGQPTPTDAAWLQFRRDQVTALVRKIYLSAAAIKPALKISAATISFAPGISTTEEWPYSAAYSSVLQDWRSWMEEGILDLNVPMAYFRQKLNGDDWLRWGEFIKNHQYHRQAVLGVGLYLNSLANALGQIHNSRRASALGNRAVGFAGYSYAGMSNNASRAKFINALTVRKGNNPAIFEHDVEPPPMPWKIHPQLGDLKGAVASDLAPHGIDGISIRLNGPAERELVTDATGFFGAVDLPPGNYTVTANVGTSSPPAQLTIVAGHVTDCTLRMSSLVRTNGVQAASQRAETSASPTGTPEILQTERR